MSNEEILRELKRCQSDITMICKHYTVFQKKFNRATQMVNCMAARGRTLLDIKKSITNIIGELENKD